MKQAILGTLLLAISSANASAIPLSASQKLKAISIKPIKISPLVLAEQKIKRLESEVAKLKSDLTVERRRSAKLSIEKTASINAHKATTEKLATANKSLTSLGVELDDTYDELNCFRNKWVISDSDPAGLEIEANSNAIVCSSEITYLPATMCPTRPVNAVPAYFDMGPTTLAVELMTRDKISYAREYIHEKTGLVTCERSDPNDDTSESCVIVFDL